MMVNRMPDTTNGHKLFYAKSEESRPVGNYKFAQAYNYFNIGVLPSHIYPQFMAESAPQQTEIMVIEINSLITKRLRRSIQAIIEPDDTGYIVRTVDLPLYASGEDTFEAINNLKEEIEELFNELQEDQNFSDEWLNYRKFLEELVID